MKFKVGEESEDGTRGITFHEVGKGVNPSTRQLLVVFSH